MWIFWLSVLVGTIILETVTADLVAIWFTGGALISLILTLCGVENLAITIPVFIVVAVGLLIAFRKLVMRLFNKGGSKTNAESVIGKEFRLLSGIGFNLPGTIKINGVVWDVITEDQDKEIEEGKIVKIIDIKGNKYIVKETK